MSDINAQIRKEEEALGLLVAAKATAYVKSKIRASTLKLKGIGSPYKRGKNEKLPVMDATFVRSDMGDNRLLGFSFISNRVGFVHHFGSTGDNARYIRTNKKTGTVFRKKTGSISSQAFFDNIYKNSGALKLLENGLANTRTRAITLQFQNTILKIEQNG